MSKVFVVYDGNDGTSAEVVVKERVNGTSSSHILHYTLTEKKTSRVHLMLERISDIVFPVFSALSNASLRRSIIVSLSAIIAFCCGVSAIPICCFLLMALGVVATVNYFDVISEDV